MSKLSSIFKTKKPIFTNSQFRRFWFPIFPKRRNLITKSRIPRNSFHISPHFPFSFKIKINFANINKIPIFNFRRKNFKKKRKKWIIFETRNTANLNLRNLMFIIFAYLKKNTNKYIKPFIFYFRWIYLIMEN